MKNWIVLVGILGWFFGCAETEKHLQEPIGLPQREEPTEIETNIGEPLEEGTDLSAEIKAFGSGAERLEITSISVEHSLIFLPSDMHLEDRRRYRLEQHQRQANRAGDLSVPVNPNIYFAPQTFQAKETRMLMDLSIRSVIEREWVDVGFCLAIGETQCEALLIWDQAHEMWNATLRIPSLKPNISKSVLTEMVIPDELVNKMRTLLNHIEVEGELRAPKPFEVRIHSVAFSEQGVQENSLARSDQGSSVGLHTYQFIDLPETTIEEGTVEQQLRQLRQAPDSPSAVAVRQHLGKKRQALEQHNIKLARIAKAQSKPRSSRSIVLEPFTMSWNGAAACASKSGTAADHCWNDLQAKFQKYGSYYVPGSCLRHRNGSDAYQQCVEQKQRYNCIDLFLTPDEKGSFEKSRQVCEQDIAYQESWDLITKPATGCVALEGNANACGLLNREGTDEVIFYKRLEFEESRQMNIGLALLGSDRLKTHIYAMADAQVDSEPAMVGGQAHGFLKTNVCGPEVEVGGTDAYVRGMLPFSKQVGFEIRFLKKIVAYFNLIGGAGYTPVGKLKYEAARFMVDTALDCSDLPDLPSLGYPDLPNLSTPNFDLSFGPISFTLELSLIGEIGMDWEAEFAAGGQGAFFSNVELDDLTMEPILTEKNGKLEPPVNGTYDGPLASQGVYLSGGPKARYAVHAKADFEALIFSAGLQFDLDLVSKRFTARLQAPLSYNQEFRGDSSTYTLDGDVYFYVENEFLMMKGKGEAYGAVEVCLPFIGCAGEDYETTLFDSSGYSKKDYLYHNSFGFSLDVYDGELIVGPLTRVWTTPQKVSERTDLKKLSLLANNGVLEVFALDDANNILHNQYNGLAWSNDWSLFGNNFRQAPVCGHFHPTSGLAPSEIHCFAFANDNELYRRVKSAGVWRPWQQLTVSRSWFDNERKSNAQVQTVFSDSDPGRIQVLMFHKPRNEFESAKMTASVFTKETKSAPKWNTKWNLRGHSVSCVSRPEETDGYCWYHHEALLKYHKGTIDPSETNVQIKRMKYQNSFEPRLHPRWLAFTLETPMDLLFTEEGGDLLAYTNAGGKLRFAVQEMDESGPRGSLERWFDAASIKTSAPPSCDILSNNIHCLLIQDDQRIYHAKFVISDQVETRIEDFEFGLVAYYPLDNGSSFNLSGNFSAGTNGNLSGVTDPQDNPSGAASFIDGGIIAPGVEITREMSLSFWVYPTATNQTFIYQGDKMPRFDHVRDRPTDLDTAFQVDLAEDRSLKFYGDGEWNNQAPKLALYQWSHVLLSYDGVNKRIYINGQRDPSHPDAYEATTTNALTNGFGALEAGTGLFIGPFRGHLDDVRIYQRLLTEEEHLLLVGAPPAVVREIAHVSLDQTWGLSNKADSIQGAESADLDLGLISHWPFDDQSWNLGRDIKQRNTGDWHRVAETGEFPRELTDGPRGHQAIRFNEQYFHFIESPSELDQTNNYSLTTWFRIPESANDTLSPIFYRNQETEIPWGYSFANRNPELINKVPILRLDGPDSPKLCQHNPTRLKGIVVNGYCRYGNENRVNSASDYDRDYFEAFSSTGWVRDIYAGYPGFRTFSVAQGQKWVPFETSNKAALWRKGILSAGKSWYTRYYRVTPESFDEIGWYPRLTRILKSWDNDFVVTSYNIYSVGYQVFQAIPGVYYDRDNKVFYNRYNRRDYVRVSLRYFTAYWNSLLRTAPLPQADYTRFCRGWYEGKLLAGQYHENGSQCHAIDGYTIRKLTTFEVLIHESFLPFTEANNPEHGVQIQAGFICRSKETGDFGYKPASQRVCVTPSNANDTSYETMVTDSSLAFQIIGYDPETGELGAPRSVVKQWAVTENNRRPCTMKVREGGTFKEYAGIADQFVENGYYACKVRTSNGTLVSEHDGYRILMLNPRAFSLEVAPNRVAVNGFETPITISKGDWHHLAVVKQGQSGMVYLNGRPFSLPSHQVMDPTGLSLSLGGKIVRGVRGGFVGDLSDMRFYGKALNQSDIRALAQRPVENTISVGTGGNHLNQPLKATVFDGTDGLVIKSLGLHPTKLSFGVWVKPAVGGLLNIVGMENTFAFYQRSNNKIGLRIGNWAGTSLETLEPNVWTHLAITLDTVSGIYQLYINGERKARFLNMPSLSLNESEFFLLGKEQSEGGVTFPAFTGSMHSFRAFRGILEDVQIKQIMGPNLEAGLKAYFPLSQNYRDANGAGFLLNAEGNLSQTKNRFGNENAAPQFTADSYLSGDVDFCDCYRFSFAAWVRPDDFQDAKVVGLTGAFPWTLQIQDSHYQFSVFDSLGEEYVAEFPMAYSDQKAWVHLVGVFDGNSIKLYRNGVLVNAQAKTRLSGRDSKWLQVGPINGAISDVYYYRRALSDNEVNKLYEHGKRLIPVASYSLAGTSENELGNEVLQTQNIQSTDGLTGNSDGAFEFHSYDSHVKLENLNLLNKTVSFYLFLREDPSDQMILSSDPDFLMIQTDGALNYNDKLITVAQLTKETWNHITLVVGNFGVVLYVNGEMVGLLNDESPTLWETLTFGNGAGQGSFSGNMTQLEIYDKGLTTNEVETIYQESIQLKNGLVAFYPFLLNANDAVGINYGNVSGAENITLQEADQKAYEFDGMNDFIQIDPQDNAITFDSDYTISLRVRPDSLTPNAGLVSKRSSSSNGYSLLLAENNGLNFDGRILNHVIYPQEWTHIAAVKSGKQRTLYINGQAHPLPLEGSESQSDSSPLTLGYDPLSHTYFRGMIDNVRLYNRALNPREVMALLPLVDDALEGLDSLEMGLVAHYTFDTENLKYEDSIANREIRRWGKPKWVEFHKALKFDGVNDDADAYLKHYPKGSSLSLMFKTDTADSILKTSMIWGKEIDVVLHINESGQLCSTINGHSICSSGSVIDNQYHHAVQILEDQRHLLYLDGALVGSATDVTPVQDAYEFIGVGSGWPASGRYFKGYLDEIRFYNRPLSDTEVALIKSNYDSDQFSNGSVLAGARDAFAAPSEVAIYPFREGAKDISGGNHHGTVSESTIQVKGPLVGTFAYWFDETDDAIALGSPEALDFDQFSLVAWIRPDDISGEHTIAAQKGGLNLSFRLKEGNYELSLGGSETVSTPIPAEDLERWVQLAGVYNGSQLALYRNGIFLASITVEPPIKAPQTAWYLGTQGEGMAPFSGALGEVRFYQGGVVEADLRRLFLKYLSNHQNHLLAYYPLIRNAHDLVSGQDLIPVGNPPFDESLERLTLEGNSDYLHTSIALNGSDSTLSFWFQAKQGNQPLLALHGNETTRKVYLDENGLLCSQIEANQLCHTIPSNDGQFHFVAQIFNSGTHRLLVDGHLLAESSVGVASLSSTNQLFLGTDATQTQFLKGALRQLSIHNEAVEVERLNQAFHALPTSETIAGQVAQYPLDQTVNDQSGMERHGQLIREESLPEWRYYTTNRHGQLRKALHLNSTQVGHVSIPWENGFPETKDFLWKAWVKTSSPIASFIEFTPEEGWSMGGLRLGLNAEGKLVLEKQAGESVIGQTSLNDNMWHQIAIGYEHSINSIALYVDGVLETKQTMPLSLTEGTLFSLGKGIGEAGFSSHMDDVAIYYDRRFTIDDLEALYLQESLSSHFAFNGDLENTSNLTMEGLTFNHANVGNLGIEGEPTSALTLDGQSHFSPSFPKLGNSEQFSIALWAKANIVQAQPLLSKLLTDGSGGEQTALLLQMTQTGNLQFMMGNGEGIGVELNGPTLAANQWFHVTVTFDQAVAQLYVNGSLVDEKPFSGTRLFYETQVEVGRYHDGTEHYFKGLVDDLRFYTTVLNAYQIRQITGLSDAVAIYRFNHNLIDEGPQAHAGTLSDSHATDITIFTEDRNAQTEAALGNDFESIDLTFPIDTISGDYTALMWVYSNPDEPFSMRVEVDSIQPDFKLQIDSDQLHLDYGSASGRTVFHTPLPKTDGWWPLALVSDSQNGQERFELWANGDLITTLDRTRWVVNGKLKVALEKTRIDDLWLINQALSEEEQDWYLRKNPHFVPRAIDQLPQVMASETAKSSDEAEAPDEFTVISRKGLMAYYPFQQGKFWDVSGNNNHLTQKQNFSIDRSSWGPRYGAVQLDDGYLSMNRKSVFDLKGDILNVLTGAWINPSQIKTEQHVVQWDNQYAVYLNTTGNLCAQLYYPETPTFCTTETIPLSEWSHVAVIFQERRYHESLPNSESSPTAPNGEAETGVGTETAPALPVVNYGFQTTIRFYLNGSFLSEQTASHLPYDRDIQYPPDRLKKETLFFGKGFTGAIDDIFVYHGTKCCFEETNYFGDNDVQTIYIETAGGEGP